MGFTSFWNIFLLLRASLFIGPFLFLCIWSEELREGSGQPSWRHCVRESARGHSRGHGLLWLERFASTSPAQLLVLALLDVLCVLEIPTASHLRDPSTSHHGWDPRQPFSVRSSASIHACTVSRPRPPPRTSGMTPELMTARRKRLSADSGGSPSFTTTWSTRLSSARAVLPRPRPSSILSFAPFLPSFSRSHRCVRTDAMKAPVWAAACDTFGVASIHPHASAPGT
mmetsp:Transcript_5491/g.33926  ORF Transcript_5491/g.33926 Transcript_5491/m.33926 type:complete len:227 (-) Transcript_5491:166-846(-)